MSLQPTALELKIFLESIMRDACMDADTYGQCVNISCAFIAMLVSNCVKAEDAEKIIAKVYEQVTKYEQAHRALRDGAVPEGKPH